MEISNQTEKWLKEVGYEYYCFVSYPRIHEDIGKFAVRVQEAIEKDLVASVAAPKVFVADREIPPGADWKQSLNTKLCRSVAMVALCVGAYYKPEHFWCGLEWAAMDKLGTGRLRGYLLRPIIPVMLRLEQPIPEAVLRTQYVEMTAASLTWERYCDTLAFKKSIRKIVDSIGDVAEAIAANEKGARNCSKFAFPNESAFVNWQPARQEFPLHAKK
jgi:hypothetical protein